MSVHYTLHSLLGCVRSILTFSCRILGIVLLHLYIAILRWFYCFAILLFLPVLFIFGLLLEYNIQGERYVTVWFQSSATLRYVIFCFAFTQPLHRTLHQSNPSVTVIDMTTLAISITWLNCASFYEVSLNAKRMSIKGTLWSSWRKLILEKQ